MHGVPKVAPFLVAINGFQMNLGEWQTRKVATVQRRIVELDKWMDLSELV